MIQQNPTSPSVQTIYDILFLRLEFGHFEAEYGAELIHEIQERGGLSLI